MAKNDSKIHSRVPGVGIYPALIPVDSGLCQLLLRRDGGEGAAVVAAVDELDGELEELLALLRVGVQAHRPLLAELRKKSGKGSENSFFRYCDVQG